MYAKRPVEPLAKSLRSVRWEPEVVPWAIALGLLLGFVAEIYWHGGMLWMAGGGIGGGLLGALCDTGRYFYRRYSKTAKPRQP